MTLLAIFVFSDCSLLHFASLCALQSAILSSITLVSLDTLLMFMPCSVRIVYLSFAVFIYHPLLYWLLINLNFALNKESLNYTIPMLIVKFYLTLILGITQAMLVWQLTLICGITQCGYGL
jgi:hypothetical protein